MRRFIKTNCLWQGPCSKLYNGCIGGLLNLFLILMCMPDLKAQCNVVPAGVSCGAFTLGDCSQSYMQTCVVDGQLAKISTGTNYTCNNVCFVLTNNPAGSSLTLASSTQLILNSSGIANKSTVPDANGFFLQNTSGLQLHNVKSEGAIYLIQTQADQSGQPPTANVCATNSSDLSNAEIDLRGNSSLVTDNVVGSVNKLWQILVADSVDLVLHNAQVLGDLLMTANGANPISVSNINNGNGCMIGS